VFVGSAAEGVLHVLRLQSLSRGRTRPLSCNLTTFCSLFVLDVCVCVVQRESRICSGVLRRVMTDFFVVV
jgi:hypothetical protein